MCGKVRGGWGAPIPVVAGTLMSSTCQTSAEVTGASDRIVAKSSAANGVPALKLTLGKHDQPCAGTLQRTLDQLPNVAIVEVCSAQTTGWKNYQRVSFCMHQQHSGAEILVKGLPLTLVRAFLGNPKAESSGLLHAAGPKYEISISLVILLPTHPLALSLVVQSGTPSDQAYAASGMNGAGRVAPPHPPKKPKSGGTDQWSNGAGST